MEHTSDEDTSDEDTFDEDTFDEDTSDEDTSDEDTSGSPKIQEEDLRNEIPLCVAVLQNDFTKLKSLLIQSRRSVNSRRNCYSRETLLQFVIRHDRVEMFDYILDLKELQIDLIDKFGCTALFYAMMSGKEYFALQLINKGADLYFRNPNRFNILNAMAMERCKNSDNLKLGQLAIEKGVDVNAQNSDGDTPLYSACEMGNFDWIYMLLYYGALATIPSNRGLLPVAVLYSTRRYLSEEAYAHLLEILISHTFEGNRIIVNLSNLVEAMKNDSLVFPKLLEITTEVDYNDSDLKNLYWSLGHLKAKNFKLFFDKFGYIIQEMMENDLKIFELLVGRDFEIEIPRGREVLLILLESNYAAELVQRSSPSYSTIALLVKNWSDNPYEPVEEEEIAKIVYLMLVHGLSVTSDDLDTVYAFYGYCELFRILLHMEIKMVYGRKKGISMAELYYDLSTNIEVFFWNTEIYFDLLGFYNHPKLKELCLESKSNEKIIAKAKSLPSVPSLLEMSRNMARKFIIDRLQIKNSMQFYTIVRSLQIPQICKKIITFDKKLY